MDQKELTNLLKEASIKYYNGEDSGMSDLEFDKKLEQLRKMEAESGIVLEGSPTVNVGASVVTELKSVTHEYPALSLGKTKYKDREDLVSWLGERDGILSWKLDGLTVVATYDNGKLTQAVTRGDGEVGSDITHNARFFKGLPQTIQYTGHLVVRGEALMTFAEFERVNAENDGVYENPRNLAASTVQMLDSKESRKREIVFNAFELVTPSPTNMMSVKFDDGNEHYFVYQKDRMRFMEYLGFNVVDHELCDSSDILNKIEEWKDKLATLNYPTDGLVISYNDMVYGMSLGNTEHHFRHSIALKWGDETVETTIRDIEWSVGKTGIITPVAIFDEVRLGLGSNVSRASLHNLSIMKSMPVTGTDYRGPIAIGSKAQVYLANMIIPQIASYTSMTGMEKDIEIPSVCPVCGQPTRIEVSNGIETLHCDNPYCSAQQMGKLMNTFSKDGLFIKGLGESQIEDLLNAWLVETTAVSFYELANEYRANSVYPKDSEFAAKVNELWKQDGWGKKKWENLISAIEASRETTLQKFLYSLNIPLLGNDLSKKLSKYWNGDINNFVSFIEKADSLNGYDMDSLIEELVSLDGIGEEKALNIGRWAAEMVETGMWEDEIKALINELHFPDATDEASDSSLEGLTFVITGSVHEYKNRDEFKASVESRGGKVAGSVSAKTSFLVNNDVESTSGKNNKAKELGIEIISEDEFIRRYGK